MVRFADDVINHNATFAEQVERMDRIIDAGTETWQGDASSKASVRRLSEKVAGTHIGVAVNAIAEYFSNFGTDLQRTRSDVLQIADVTAPAAGMSVHDDGVVVPPVAPGDQASAAFVIIQSQLNQRAREFQESLQTLLVQFSDIENAAVAAIAKSHDELRELGSSPDGGRLSGPVQDILGGRAELPTEPKQLNDFWKTLSPAEKDALFATDQYIGNRDGIPAVDRDHYNRIKLDDELTRARTAQASVSKWEEKYPNWAGGDSPGPPPPTASSQWKDTYADYVLYEQAKRDAKNLTELEAVNAAVDGKDGRHLMLFDTQTGVQPRAAVAIGNPDTATHVSVTTPGLNTTVTSLGSMSDEAEAVKREAERQLNDANRRSETVATIAFIGYDPPQIAGQDLPGAIEGGWDVARDEVAQQGAVDLARFYDGIAASNHHDDPHITAVGHSYGSLTTGIALQQSDNNPVDDVIVYGSPGIQASTPSELGVNDGHAFVMRADDDLIAWAQDGPKILDTSADVVAGALIPILPGLSDLPWTPDMPSPSEGAEAVGFGDLGPDPAANPNFTRLETDPTVVRDGRHLEGATGHSDYPRLGNNGEIRTTGYNIAAIVAGIVDDAQVAK